MKNIVLILVCTLVLFGCKKEEVKKHFATFKATSTTKNFSMMYGETTTGQNGDLFTKDSDKGLIEVTIEVKAEKGKELQLVVTSKEGGACFFETEVILDGKSLKKTSKACPAGVHGLFYKFE